MSTIAIFGSYVLSHKVGPQHVLCDHWILVEGKKIAAVTRDRPSQIRSTIGRAGIERIGVQQNKT